MTLKGNLGTIVTPRRLYLFGYRLSPVPSQKMSTSRHKLIKDVATEVGETQCHPLLQKRHILNVSCSTPLTDFSLISSYCSTAIIFAYFNRENNLYNHFVKP